MKFILVLLSCMCVFHCQGTEKDEIQKHIKEKIILCYDELYEIDSKGYNPNYEGERWIICGKIMALEDVIHYLRK